MGATVCGIPPSVGLSLTEPPWYVHFTGGVAELTLDERVNDTWAGTHQSRAIEIGRNTVTSCRPNTLSKEPRTEGPNDESALLFRSGSSAAAAPLRRRTREQGHSDCAASQ